MSDIKKCPHCGRKLHDTAMYCMYCMTSLTPKKDITPDIPERKTGIVIACVLLTVLLLLGCFFLLGKKTVLRSGKWQAKEKNIGETTSAQTEEDNLLPSASETQDTTYLLEETEPDIQKPPETSGNEPDDPVTKPPQTDPDTKPSEENPQTPTQPLCSHYYLSATCIAPATCQKCGDTLGGADETAHVWKPVTAVIHHEEVGHYEQVEDYYKKTVYLCFFCGYNQDGFDSLDDLREHISVHAGNSNYEWIVSAPDLRAETREIWATRLVEEWVVDQEAYDETVITGYICTVCNKQKAL